MIQEDEGSKAPTPDPELFQEEDLSVLVKRTQQVQRREWWVGWSSVWANFFVPFSILLAALAFWQQIKETKRYAAAQQINQFYSEGMIEAQTLLFSLWTDQDLNILLVPQSRTFVDAFVDRTIQTSSLDSSDVMMSIISITSYFDRVEACISDGRCDQKDVISQIGLYGRDFHCIYSGQIQSYQRDLVSTRLGEGLAAFSDRLGGCGG